MIRIERVKLFANYLSTMAAGIFVAGVIAPGVNVALGAAPSVFPVAYFALGGVALSIVLHLIGQASLGRLYG